MSTEKRKRSKGTPRRKKEEEKKEEGGEGKERIFEEERKEKPSEGAQEMAGAYETITSELKVQGHEAKREYEESARAKQEIVERVHSQKPPSLISGTISKFVGGRQEKVKNIISKIQNTVGSRVEMAKNMYSLFQGMKNMYGGDTKKVLSVMLNFAKEETKRRINEQKEKIKKKIKR